MNSCDVGKSHLCQEHSFLYHEKKKQLQLHTHTLSHQSIRNVIGQNFKTFQFTKTLIFLQWSEHQLQYFKKLVTQSVIDKTISLKHLWFLLIHPDPLRGMLILSHGYLILWSIMPCTFQPVLLWLMMEWDSPSSGMAMSKLVEADSWGKQLFHLFSAFRIARDLTMHTHPVPLSYYHKSISSQ